jgi:hypothetical protein
MFSMFVGALQLSTTSVIKANVSACLLGAVYSAIILKMDNDRERARHTLFQCIVETLGPTVITRRELDDALTYYNFCRRFPRALGGRRWKLMLEWVDDFASFLKKNPKEGAMWNMP